MALDPEHFVRWMHEYGESSRRDDPDASAALFADDALYHESPFDEPIVGRAAIREYWAQGAESLTDKQSSFDILAVTGDRGVANWRSAFTNLRTGTRTALDCIFVVTFDADGQCTDFHEWWHHRQIDPDG